jgi:hypothetical protein
MNSYQSNNQTVIKVIKWVITKESKE